MRAKKSRNGRLWDWSVDSPVPIGIVQSAFYISEEYSPLYIAVD